MDKFRLKFRFVISANKNGSLTSFLNFPQCQNFSEPNF